MEDGSVVGRSGLPGTASIVGGFNHVDHELWVRWDERRRIGRELHDSTAQLLVALQLRLKHFTAAVKGAECNSTLYEIDETIRGLHREIRAVSSVQDMTPVAGGELPQALVKMADDFGRLTGLEIAVVVEGTYIAKSARLESSLYRIAQEALANVQRHARARCVEIRVRSTPRSLRMIITDDGIGIGTGSANVGVGLDSIRQRATELNGKLSVRQLDQGTRIMVALA